jgi:hypothetical protein
LPLSRRMNLLTVVPGGLDQEAAYMDIAGLGNGATVFPASGKSTRKARGQSRP